MNYKVFISIYAFVLILAVSLVAGGCANIVPPQGGFRDSLPPTLLKATPASSSTNFTGKKLNFSFDEYITVENFQQNLLMSPLPKLTPAYISKLNTLTVTLKDTLEPNTTYILNFGDAIKDVNEGNIMKNFSYVFSTGSYIDSLSFRGNVIVAETGEVDSTLSVVLYKNPDDSATRKERPRYVTKLDKNGNFVFKNLPGGTFYVYALKDESRSYRYLNNRDLFAFADSPVIVGQSTPSKTLYAYQAEKAKETGSGTTGRTNVNDKRLKFQTSLGSAGGNQDLTKEFSLQFERPLRNFDSTKIRFASDSSYTPVTGYSWILDSTKKKATLNYTWNEATAYHLILQKDFAADTLGQQLLRADTITFKTLGKTDYGQLAIRFRNLDLSKNPVLQFVLNGLVMSSFPLTGDRFSKTLFVPGDYELRILYDANKNGIWDPGQFFGKHIQPELVKPIKTRKYTIRSNYENEFEIAL